MEKFKRPTLFFLLVISLFLSIQAPAAARRSLRKEKQKIVAVGAGMAGLMNAYFAFKEAQKKGIPLRYKIYEENERLLETSIDNSLAPDEMLSEEEGMLQLGKMSMDLWQKLYDSADDELKAIFEASNFSPCREPRKNERALHDGYRIDLMYGVSDAETCAQNMKQQFQAVGYAQCKILSPSEVIELDPFLKDFCLKHSRQGSSGQRKWNKGSIALFRPGGFIDSEVFLPKFYDYLKKVMGTYISQAGREKDAFRIKFNTKVTGVNYARHQNRIKGLFFENGTKSNANAKYLFCPAETISALTELGFKVPSSTEIVRGSLSLEVPVSQRKVKKFSTLHHYMEVRKEGAQVSLQASSKERKVFIRVTGGREALLQLNMINDVLPEVISMALGRITKGKKLDESDLADLESKGIAKRQVDTHAVISDQVPLLGSLYNTRNNRKVKNGFVLASLGSGSFSPVAAASINGCFPRKGKVKNPIIRKALRFASSKR